MQINLRPFQERALSQYRPAFVRSPGVAKLGVAPTAFGKTIFMGYLAHKMCPQGYRFVVLSHRETLVDGNAKKIAKVDSSLNIAREIAKEHAEGDCDVVSASIATLKGTRALNFAERMRGDGRKIFLCTDEAHHSLADSYLNFFTLLNPDEHLGLTATPFRGTGEDLTAVYPETAFVIERSEMIDDGWLARPHHFTIDSEISLESVKTRGGEYVEKDLVRVLDTDVRNNLIVEAAVFGADYLKSKLNQPVARAVCFTINVDHAIKLEEQFRAAGWEAYAIHGGTPIEDRRHADLRLKESDKDIVLLSCGVLTEGWDVEECNLGLFSRPTKSAVLMDQMIGRVLRWLESKPGSLLLDIADRDADDRVTIASSFKLPPIWDAKGLCLREDERWFNQATETAPIQVAAALWECGSRDEAMALLNDPSNARLCKLEGREAWWKVGAEARLVIRDMSLVCRYTIQGGYVAEMRRGLDREVITHGRDLIQLCRAAETWAIEKFPQETMYLGYQRKDKGDPPTEKQIELLDKMGVTYPPEMTRAQASELIDTQMLIKNRELESGIMTFGKYKGQHVSKIPTHYVKFMVHDEKMAWMRGKPIYRVLATELSRRGEVEPA